MKCEVCFRHCDLDTGQTGFCRGRKNNGDSIVPVNYGVITSLALDPIEKKPLMRFHPGKRILSLGSYGCNLRCPFCQNYEISQTGEGSFRDPGNRVDPGWVASKAIKERERGNIGVAFTYNEPLISYEFIRDTGKLVHAAGLKNVLVSNGTCSLSVLEEILPLIDAMNIDLKCFSEEVYRDVLKGSLKETMAFIERAAENCHLEITTLIVPGLNDSDSEIRELTSWIASLDNGRGKDIPWHVTRFFPQYEMTDRGPTDVSRILELAAIGREQLNYVYEGNI